MVTSNISYAQKYNPKVISGNPSTLFKELSNALMACADKSSIQVRNVGNKNQELVYVPNPNGPDKDRVLKIISHPTRGFLVPGPDKIASLFYLTAKQPQGTVFYNSKDSIKSPADTFFMNDQELAEIQKFQGTFNQFEYVRTLSPPNVSPSQQTTHLLKLWIANGQNGKPNYLNGARGKLSYVAWKGRKKDSLGKIKKNLNTMRGNNMPDPLAEDFALNDCAVNEQILNSVITNSTNTPSTAK